MGRKQEFVCGSCGIVTDSPRFTIQCPTMNGGPHSWSAIPMAANQEVNNHTPFKFNIRFSLNYAILGFIGSSALIFASNPHFSNIDSVFLFLALIGAIISGFILKPLIGLIIGLALFFLLCWLLDLMGLINTEENKPNNPPPKVLKVNK